MNGPGSGAWRLCFRGALLLCAVVTTATASGPEPVKVQAAQRSFNEAYRQGEWARAVTDMRRAARDFRAAGYTTTLRILPGIGHASPDPAGGELSTALRWVLGR